MKFDGGTKGKKDKRCPKHSQETKLIQPGFYSSKQPDDHIFPTHRTKTVSAGEKAVTQFPVKY